MCLGIINVSVQMNVQRSQMGRNLGLTSERRKAGTSIENGPMKEKTEIAKENGKRRSITHTLCQK